MKKVLGTVAIVMLVAMLLQVPCYASSSSYAKDMETSEVSIKVETLMKDQLITMAEGKTYILSYPAIGEGWNISGIRLKTKNTGWITIKEGEENKYLWIERCEPKQDRIMLKVKCKRGDIIALKVIMQNEQTQEIQEYALKLAFAKKVENDTYDDLWVVIVPDDSEENPDLDDGNLENPGDKEPDKELIVIDTSDWVFQGIQTTYDGKEYVALVKGLPDYVTPIYHNNTRTNAGSNKAYVEFKVPEGYAVPEGMETEIVVDKASIEEISLDKMWMRTDLVNGTIKIQAPVGAIPNGVVNCTYEVNGIEVGNDYTITDTGVYSVKANFSLTEEMKDNYELKTETAKAIYQVNPESFSTPKYNLYLSELESSDGQKQVSVWIDYIDKNFSTAGVNLHLRYDPEVLELNKAESTAGPNTSYPLLSPYDGSDSSGNCSILASGAFSNGVALENLVFNVKDSEATDIVVNITDITASDADIFSGNPAESTNGYGIILNQESNIISVTLPSKPADTKAVADPTTVELASNDVEADDTEITEEQTEEVEEILTDESLEEEQTEEVDTEE